MKKLIILILKDIRTTIFEVSFCWMLENEVLERRIRFMKDAPISNKIRTYLRRILIKSYENKIAKNTSFYITTFLINIVLAIPFLIFFILGLVGHYITGAKYFIRNGSWAEGVRFFNWVNLVGFLFSLIFIITKSL